MIADFCQCMNLKDQIKQMACLKVVVERNLPLKPKMNGIYYETSLSNEKYL